MQYGNQNHEQSQVTQVKGFNLRRWMGKNRKRVPPMLDAIAKLINGDRLRIAYTECDCHLQLLDASPYC